MNAIYLEADTINGITAFDYADLTPDMEFIAPQEFAEQLDALDDGEVIRTIITHENDPIYRKMVADYGIH